MREPLAETEPTPLEAVIPAAHEPLRDRADAYGARVFAWMHSRSAYGVDDPRDPRAVVTWFRRLLG